MADVAESRTSVPLKRGWQLWSLEVVSRLVCIAALLVLARRTWFYAQQHPGDLRLTLLLVAEALTITLIVAARPPAVISRRPLVVGATVISSCYFLLLDLSGGRPLIPAQLGWSVQMVGILVEILAKVRIGRSFGLLPSNRGLVTTGPYAWVRHPMYLGYFIGHIGFLAAAFSWRNLALYGLLYLFLVYRIIKEEELLQQTPQYRAYTQRVRYRLLPWIF